MDVVTFGQYMRPTKRHMKVERYVEPAEFDRWKQVAEDMGFLYVASGPLVRSSYKVGTLSFVCLSQAPITDVASSFGRRASSSLKMFSRARVRRRRRRCCWPRKPLWQRLYRQIRVHDKPVSPFDSLRFHIVLGGLMHMVGAIQLNICAPFMESWTTTL